ncbi:MAG: hypothetical protein Tp185DCM00d2C31949971_4 [Prokaryotic dsDNA virus sp.]|uniref:hypothetical protein n=1 Tax=Gammaproteobacteria TaxID=1236 RepID=UPI000C5C04D4|nr:MULTISPECIES: hypothetical protein [Gammaproteobacteria]MBP58942.1 hypothetical protein [Idiomarina sp.]QDP60888.1 MAG: hypothetical protein Tp185DCM00d2C31949971_4 [Prokaryotic dsDNA virus sp.]QDP61777.1 MAG: hypothetical protein Tp1111MES1053591_16 [Prokaryotic dsDNA virus sp.]HCC80418.1 hypothetical protein [Methylophaga sp.]|tara:strand:+ start:2474 stop:2827 length:354 start_codon:yes stop_codon:yes gene_type:complete
MSENGNQAPTYCTYIYKKKRYSRDDLAVHLGINKNTFQSWVLRYGRVNAIAIAELPKSERKAEMRRLVNKRKPEMKSKIDQFDIPKLDPYYEERNRLKHWIRRYGMEGAIAKASLRI